MEVMREIFEESLESWITKGIVRDWMVGILKK
jgi:hypothetical protein